MPPSLGTTLVTQVGYIDDLDSGENARARCPIFTKEASGNGTEAVSTFRALSMRPAVRTHVWMGRTDTALSVNVTSEACVSLTAAPAAFVLLPSRDRSPAGSEVSPGRGRSR